MPALECFVFGFVKSSVDKGSCEKSVDRLIFVLWSMAYYKRLCVQDSFDASNAVCN